MSKKFISFLCWILLPGILFCQSDFSRIFTKVELTLPDRIEDIFSEYLNDDKMADIVVVTKAKDGNVINIFFQGDKGISPVPQQFRFERGAIFFDFGDITDKYPGKEIVYFTDKAVKYYYLQGNAYSDKPEKLMDITSVFQSYSEECPLRGDFIFDLDKNNSNMIFVPGAYEMTILGKDAGQYKIRQKIKMRPYYTSSSHLKMNRADMEEENFSHKFVVRVPRIYMEDFNGDGKKDVISIFKDHLEVYFLNANGHFSTNPDFKTKLDVLTQKEKDKILRPQFHINTLDLDNRDLIDVVVTKTSMKSNSSMTKIYVYLNKKGRIEHTPDQIIILDDSIGYPRFRDLNGDGKKDIIISEVNLGFFQILKILITQKVNYKERIYLRKGDKFADRPDFKLKSQAQFDMDRPGSFEGEFMYFEGDYNGDKTKDLLKTVSSKKKIYIYHGDGTKNDLYSSKPSVAMEEETMPNSFIIKDLNDDGISDIIFDYRLKRKKKVTVLLSKGK
ncbi:MAG: VCBS repeat-containing protein [bacterium]|nr:VCBS repeat-containing protein [bacterium]